jgi:autoinducer 2-degrading protein
MIIRIVKLTFEEDGPATFLSLFEANQEAIRGAEGCHHLELLRDQSEPTIFFTYSLWESEECLNAYRDSELFGSVWPKLKPLFSAKPEAWSLDKLADLP